MNYYEILGGICGCIVVLAGGAKAIEWILNKFYVTRKEYSDDKEKSVKDHMEYRDSCHKEHDKDKTLLTEIATKVDIIMKSVQVKTKD